MVIGAEPGHTRNYAQVSLSQDVSVRALAAYTLAAQKNQQKMGENCHVT